MPVRPSCRRLATGETRDQRNWSLHWAHSLSIKTQDAARSLTTKALASTVKSAAVVIGLGLVDRVAWWLAYGHQSWQYAGWVIVALAAALRVLYA
jgi:hypothetical protein